jgi:hypothetical protein
MGYAGCITTASAAAKNFLKDHVNHPIANTAVKAAEALGYGMTGGTNNKLQSRLM